MRYQDEPWVQGIPGEEGADKAERRYKWLWVPWIVVILGLVWFLAGCASREEIMAKRVANCQAMGYASQTDIAGCVERSIESDRAAWATWSANTSNTLGNMSNTVMQQPSYARPVTSTCRQNPYNGQVYCTSY